MENGMLEWKMELTVRVPELNSFNNPPQSLHLKDWNLARVCSWIEDTAGYNLDNILLWKVAQPSEKPFIYLSVAFF